MYVLVVVAVLGVLGDVGVVAPAHLIYEMNAASVEACIAMEETLAPIIAEDLKLMMERIWAPRLPDDGSWVVTTSTDCTPE